MAMRGWGFPARAGILALAVSLACAVVSPAGAIPAPHVPTTDYPSWAEVQAAKGNEEATAATVSHIQASLASLQVEAARLGDEAVRLTAIADRARVELRRATEIARSLSDQADAAAARASQSSSRAAALSVALYRSGGAGLTTDMLVGTGAGAGAGAGGADLLDRLGMLDKVGAQLQLVLQRSEIDRNEARAASDQASVARAERDRQAAATKIAADTAATAASAAEAAVASEQSHLNDLYAQLADLKNTTVQLEQQYEVGQQASNGGGSVGGGIDVPPSDGNDPAAAQAFAFSMLAGYGFGADQNSCLLSLWNRESGWRTNAYNSSSGAYGIPQSLPGSKMAAVGADWRTSYTTQVTWGILYILGRYSSPCGAWSHSESVGWY
jgi:hypothetical protein